MKEQVGSYINVSCQLGVTGKLASDYLIQLGKTHSPTGLCFYVIKKSIFKQTYYHRKLAGGCGCANCLKPKQFSKMLYLKIPSLELDYCMNGIYFRHLTNGESPHTLY